MRVAARRTAAARWVSLGVAASLLLTGCGGKLNSEEPLAPVPTKVRDDEIEPAPLRVEWTRMPRITEDPEEQERERLTQPPALDSRHAYTVHGRRIRALALSDGAIDWEVNLASPVALTPVPVGEHLAVATTDGRWTWIDAAGRITSATSFGARAVDAAPMRGALVLLDAGAAHQLSGWDGGDGPAVIWTTTVEDPLKVTVAPDSDEIWIVDARGGVTAITASSGQILWRTEEALAIDAPVAADAKYVYVAGSDNRLRALRRTNGRRAWIGKEMGIRTVAAPVVVDRVVWIVGLDAALHGFAARNGSHLFRVKIGGRSYLDLAVWRRWVIASPVTGPWALVRGPLRSIGPTDPGQPRQVTIGSSGEIDLPPATAEPGVLVIDATGAVRLLRLAPADRARRGPDSSPIGQR